MLNQLHRNIEENPDFDENPGVEPNQKGFNIIPDPSN